MRLRDLELLAGEIDEPSGAEAALVGTTKEIRDWARLILANRRLALDCGEHEFEKVGKRSRGDNKTELDRPFQCINCGYRVYEEYVRAYAKERPARDEWRRLKAEAPP
jgi:predicted Zn-ribbon and HTH transcriptional regulator